jgi:hypothetical protein
MERPSQVGWDSEKGLLIRGERLERSTWVSGPIVAERFFELRSYGEELIERGRRSTSGSIGP